MQEEMLNNEQRWRGCPRSMLDLAAGVLLSGTVELTHGIIHDVGDQPDICGALGSLTVA